VSALTAADVARIRSATDLLALVAEHHPPAQRMAKLHAFRRQRGQPGHRYGVRCPFCQSAGTPKRWGAFRNATFMINTETRLWHCAACNKTGDAFAFLQAMTGCSFAEAAEKLDAVRPE
jgi:hypothetical protein